MSAVQSLDDRLRRRVATIVGGALAVAGLAWASACVDMSAPSGSPASISIVHAPALFVVAGDAMRDSTGAPAPLALTAYDGHGNPVTGFTPAFFITDTTRLATIGADDILRGTDTGTVHVIGQIGDVQTPPVTIYVTLAPDSLASGQLPSDTINATGGSDTTTARGSYAATVRVLAADGLTGVPGVQVSFAIAYVPALRDTAVHAVYLAGDDGKPSSLDTASVGGTASRRVVVLTPFLADSALQSGQRTDSIVVVARAEYKGQPLHGSPARLAIPLRVVF